MKKKHGVRFACGLVLCALLAQLMTALAMGAQTAGQTVLRVAFPQLAGFTVREQNGERHGLVVDWLDEIAKYTGWTYEYVDTTGEEMTDAFLRGEYDLMGGAFYMETLASQYAYPDYSTGTSESVLLARADDPSVRGYDMRDLNGKTIGVFARAEENTRRLEQFLEMNGVTCMLRRFSNAEAVDGTLYPYLERGEIDLLLGNAVDDTGRFRAVAWFDSQPHYIVTTPDRPEILAQLNWAMEQVLKANPDFAQQTYDRNFPNVGAHRFALDSEEQAYVRQKGTVTVAVPQRYHPFFCEKDANAGHSGITIDMLAAVQAFSGLRFTYVETESYAQAIELVATGQADLLGFFLGDEAQAIEAGLALSTPFVTLSDLVVRHKSVTYPSEGLRCGVLRGRELPDAIDAAVAYYDMPQQALHALNRGEIDIIYGLSAQLENGLQQNIYPNAIPVSIADSSNDICFALRWPVEPALLTILNKTINGMPAGDRQDIAAGNMVAVGQGRLTLQQIIYANPLLVIGSVTALLLLVVAAVSVAAHGRVRAARMQSEKERAQAEGRAKSAFLSRMSHEIRTPMNAIVGITELMSVKNAPETQQAYLSKLRTSAQYLLNLINDILDINRIDSEMLTVDSEPFSLTCVIDEVQSMMRAEAARRDLRLSVDQQISHAWVRGDAIRIKQVLVNLLSNAIKFTPAGGSVSLLARENASDPDSAVFDFAVADTGVGIPPEDQERIFHAFEQTGSNHTKSQGTGLGLPLARHLVRLMGGELRLTSEGGKGSVFTFAVTLPRCDAADMSEPVANPYRLADMHVLLAEDNEINAEIAQSLLELQGARVTLAQDGRQAVACFAQSAPGGFDAVLMDVQMPIMNGHEAARGIRALDRPDAQTVPILAMTANSFQNDKDEAKAAGMDDFLSKPIDVDALYAMLHRYYKERP